MSGNDTEELVEEQIHTSVLLEKLIAEAPVGHFTLEWLIGNLPKHSFGFILLFLTLIALLPVISIIARVLIIILTFQIILGYRSPVLPRRFMLRPLPAKYLIGLRRYALPALRHLENVVRPRWTMMFKGTRRFTAFIVMIGTALSLPAPLPLANMPPAAMGALLAFAFIEHDGLMLFFTLVTAITLLAIVTFLCLHPFIF
jgi:hypothetical protein